MTRFLGRGAFTDPAVNTGMDAFQANGDGLFDIQVLFDNSDGDSNRFGVGDSAEYTITGFPALDVESFNFLSAMGGGQGRFRTAAHVGGIGPNDQGSGWIAPEPGTLSLLVLGVACAARRRN